jgi:hypothetical protein
MQRFSLTPGFSRVWAAHRPASRFNGLPAAEYRNFKASIPNAIRFPAHLPMIREAPLPEQPWETSG